MKWIDSVSEFPSLAMGGGAFLPTEPNLQEIAWNRFSLRIVSLFGCWRWLFCQVPNVMFNDAWNTVWQMYITWHNTSWVSHQMAEKGGGGVRPICIKLRFCLLNTVVFRRNNKRLINWHYVTIEPLRIIGTMLQETHSKHSQLFISFISKRCLICISLHSI